jgi:uncharacterized membrane protein
MNTNFANEIKYARNHISDSITIFFSTCTVVLVGCFLEDELYKYISLAYSVLALLILTIINWITMKKLVKISETQNRTIWNLELELLKK